MDNSKKKNLIFSAVFLLFLGVLFYFLFAAQRGQPVDFDPLTSEEISALEEARPTLSQDREEFLDLLLSNIRGGGPGKDGIPSIDEPQYTSAEEADEWLEAEDVVFGIVQGDFVAAYPQRILVWHEIVNKEIDGEKHSVTYCPLTGTAIGFKGDIGGVTSAELGVSGQLINSNLVMYDRASDSYWAQILGMSVKGPARGIALNEFPVVWTTWDKWKAEHPDTLVLSQDTGFTRNYGVGGDLYGSYIDDDMGYYGSDRLIFGVVNESDELARKDVVVGVRDAEGNAVAVLKDKLRQDGTVEASLTDESTVVIEYNEALDFYEASIKETGEWINAFDAMWFAWAAFYPDTQLIK